MRLSTATAFTSGRCIDLGTVSGYLFVGWLCVIGAVGGSRVNSNLHLVKQWAHLR